MKPRALLICPLHPVRQQLVEVVRQSGTTHVVTASVRESTAALMNGKYDVIISGRKLGDGSSNDLLRAAKAAQPGVPVVVVSRTGNWDEYVEAINRGAFDLLPADGPPSESARIISNALRASASSRVAAPAVETRDKSRSGKL